MAYQPELEKLQRQYQDDPARYFAQLAEAYRRGGRLDEALAMLREHLAARPSYVSGLIVLGRCLLDQQNDVEARETFERVLVVDQEHIIALRALGEIGERTGDVTSARRWFQRLLEIDPMNDEAVAALGRLPTVPPESAPAEPAAAPAVVLDEAPEADAAVEEVPFEARTAGFAGSEAAAPEDELAVERASAEPDTAADEVPWAPTTPEEDGRAVAFEEGQELADQAVGGSDDVSGWVEHPEELLTFDETSLEGPPPGGEFAVEAFDESLGWGAGERVSRQVSADDLDAAEHARAEDLAAPVQELPGLEDTAPPSEDEAAALTAEAHLEGLQQVAGDPGGEPVEGLETGDALMQPAEPAPPTFAMADADADADAPPVPQDESDQTSLAGLPVFFPPEEETREPLRVEPEPEPVVTETMAELYVRQGLVGEARETYRQLLAGRPYDQRLAARLAELQEPGPTRDARTVYAASATGGQTSRSFLGDILGGRGEAVVEPGPAVLEQPPAAPGPEPEPMDRAFGNETPEPRGEPTHPAQDEISLAAIFGEQSPPPASPEAAPAAETAGRPAGGFSFDDFFSAQPPAPSEAAPPRASRDTMADDEGDEAFRDWLKGLKS